MATTGEPSVGAGWGFAAQVAAFSVALNVT
jgi:hypothetical protein